MTRLLSLLAGMLMVVIAAETSSWQRPAAEFGPAASVGPTAAVRPPVAPVRHPPPQTKADMDRWVSVILARPLFAQDRRPDRGAPTAATAAGVPRLSGTIVAPDECIAIFQAKGAKPQVARPGDLGDGWVVSSIAANGVDLRKADARITLTPEFEDVARAPAPAAADQMASRWVVAPPTGLLRERWSNPQLQP